MWISIKDKLPEIRKIVLLSDGAGITCVGRRISDDTYAMASSPLFEMRGELVAFCYSRDFDPVFWHKLPQPIKIK